MSNNTPDYENNLTFAPTSADDLNKQCRQSDVLVAALEKCEKLEKQLKIAISGLEKYKSALGMAEIIDPDGNSHIEYYPLTNDDGEIADQALKEIKEIK